MRLLLIALLTLVPMVASAKPYFRTPFNGGKLHKLTGASVDPINTGNTSFVSEVALATHSTEDGCLFPSIVCEDWTPLAIGPSYNAGKFAVVLGPVMNLAPASKRLLLSGMNMMTGDETLVGVKNLLASSAGDIAISFGPQLWVNPIAHGVILPLNQWAPAGRIFAGTELRF